MRRFLLNDTHNTRDLGGYPIDYKKVTAYKVFLRSDVPLKVSDEDKVLLLSNNIKTIVDLRSDYEAESRPCGFKLHKDFQYHHCKIFGDGRLPDSVEAVSDSYFEMIDEQKSVLNVMRIFANTHGGILFHCTAGKDRTGVISALLLLLAGVQKTDILADYHISSVYLEPMLQQYCKSNKNVDINIITPKTEYMEKFLDMFQHKYNSVEEYFYQIGLTSSEVLQLKTKLVNNL